MDRQPLAANIHASIPVDIGSSLVRVKDEQRVDRDGGVVVVLPVPEAAAKQPSVRARSQADSDVADVNDACIDNVLTMSRIFRSVQRT